MRAARTIYDGRAELPRWQDTLRALVSLRDPRRAHLCKTCDGIGMVESSYGEDVCPVCEGGVWANVETWRQHFKAMLLPFGYRVRLKRHGWRLLYKDFPV